MADEVKDALVASAEADAASGEQNEAEQGEQTSQSTFDPAAISRRLDEVAANAASRAELDGLRRQAGHVPALQSELAALRKEVEESQSYRERVDALETLLLNNLPVDEAARLETERTQRASQAALDARFAEIESRVVAPAEKTEETPVDPGVAAYQAAAVAATEAIHSYATERGIDPTAIPAEVYAQAQAAHQGNLAEAANEVAAWIDAKAGEADAEARRAERAADAAGGDPTTRAGGNGQYDLNTITGLTQARNAGAIDSAQFTEGWRKLRGGI